MTNLPSWLQAGAALLQTLFALLLWRVTRKYVQLTHQQSDTAARQLDMMREVKAFEHRATLVELEYLAKRLLDSFAELPESENVSSVDRRMREGSLWSEHDLHVLSALAAKVGSDAAEHSKTAVQNLLWIANQVESVRQVSVQLGFNWKNFPWPEWKRRSDELRNELKALEEVARTHPLRSTN